MKVFANLKQKFRKIREAKMKEGIFSGPQNYITMQRPRLLYSMKFYRKKSLEGILKHLQTLSRQRKSRKLQWSCVGVNFVVQCCEVEHVTGTLFLFGFFS